MRLAEVAQLAEQLIRNQQIVGSSPIFSSIFRSNIIAAIFLCDLCYYYIFVVE